MSPDPVQAPPARRGAFQAAAYVLGFAFLYWLLSAHVDAVLHPGRPSRETLAIVLGTIVVALCAWRAGDSLAEGVGGGAFFLMMAFLLWVSLPAYNGLLRKTEAERRIALFEAEKGPTDGKQAIAVFAAALRDPDPLVRLGAALRLRGLRSAGEPARAAMTAAADDPDALVAATAREALAMLPDPAPAAR